MKNFLLLPLLLLCGAGCMQIDYVGKKFTPSENVRIYRSQTDIPTGEYTIIGRFTASVKPSVHPYEVEDAVFDKSVEYGGDAMVLVKKKDIMHGAYNSDAEEFGTFDPANRKIPENEAALFGKSKPLSAGDMWSKRVVYHYLLLKKSSSLNPAE